MDEVGVACRLVVGVVFLWSAIAKIRDIPAFSRAVQQHASTAPLLSVGIAWTIVGTEALVAVTLLTGVLATFGLALAMFLLGVFFIVMVRNAFRHSPIPCHCFGEDESDAKPVVTLVRILMLLVAAMSCWYAGLEDGFAAPSPAAFAFGAALLLLAIWVLWFPFILKLHRLPVPKGISPSRRVSFRNSPLEPIRISAEEK